MQRHSFNLRQWLRASLQLNTLFGVAMIGLIWTGLALHLSEEKNNALQAAKQNASNLTRAFEEYVVRVVEEGDKALLSLRARYAKNPKQFAIGDARIYLDDMILQIGVTGPDGILKATTLPLARDVRMDLSNQEHYRIHLNTDKDELFISKPVIGRTTGKTNIQLSRRLSNPDGSFAGVIIASIDQSSMARFYNSIDIGNDGTIVVMGLDHVVRVSRGFKNIRPDGSYPVHFLFKKLQESSTGTFVMPGHVDGIGWLVSYRQLKNLPLIVAVGLAQHEVFADYWEGRSEYYIAAAVLTAGILFVIFLTMLRQRKLVAARAAADEAQQALVQSQERYQLVETAVNDGIFDRNILTGEAYFSPRWKSILGYADDEIPNVASAFFDLIHPDDKSVIPEVQRAHLEENKPYVLEFRLRCKDGGYRWVRSRGKVFRDAANRPVRILGSMTDITERKQAEVLIEESYDNLELAEAMALLGHYKYELKSTALIWSEGIYRILGQSPASFTPTLHNVSELVHPDDRAALEQYRRDVMTGLELPSMTLRFVKDGGQIVYVENWARPLRSSDGRVTGMFGTIQDVTARKQAEVLVEESRSNLARAERMARLGHYKYDPASNAYSWSEGVYRIFGKSPKSFTPTLSSALELIHPDDRPILEQYRRDVIAGLDVPRQTLRAVRDDGQVIYIEFWSVPVRADDGSMTGMFGTLQDVTARTQAQEALERANRELIEVQYAIDQAVIVAITDLKGTITHVNDHFCRISGYSREELLGANHRLLNSGTHPKTFFRDMYRQIANGQVWRGELQNKTKDGTLYWLNTTIVPQLGPDGKPVAYMAIRVDITAGKRVEMELDRSQRFVNTIIENVPVPIFVKDANDRRYILVNQAGETFWGISRADMIGKTVHEVFPKKEADLIAAREEELLRSGQPLFDEREILTPRNGIRSIVSKRLAIRDDDGKLRYLIGVIEDVTERKRTETQIAYMARHDVLTGIANRIVFQEKMKEALARLRRRQESFSIFVMDLDGFKHINDTLGHAAGDKLLKELALRLRSSLRETETVARLGGDEFAIIQGGETDQREGAIALALKVLEITAKPFDLDDHSVTVGASIGIAVAPEDGTDAGELLQKADLALYRVKSEGRNNFCFFDAEMGKGAGERLQLLSDMRAALSRKEFELFYQPLFEAKTRRPCGVEALVRWRHPVHGLIPPDRFIPLAEETGLMEPLGEWILERACTDAAAWPEHIKVAVNLSAVQFRTGKLFDVILCALVESGLPPERLELEITESVLMQNAESYGVVLQQLKNIGVAIVLDDFGTGYSSLSYLTTFPFDKIKIDKSFTQGLTSNTGCAASVASVLTLARGLDIIVTAEGVETKQQFELLRASGVHQIQGYLFGRPTPLAELNFDALELKGQAVAAA